MISDNQYFLNADLMEISASLQKADITVISLLELTSVLSAKYNPRFSFYCSELSSPSLPSSKSPFSNPLYGIPYAAKDIYNTSNICTQMGSKIWKGFTPGNNARIIDKLIDSGAILTAKTVTAEFAIHALNSTLNPFDITRTPGTSSSGSAVSVSLGVVPFALATQTAGSIIRPSSFCGVFGFKPSYGLLPRTGILKTTDTLDTPGFIAARLSSLRILLNSTRVRGPNYPQVTRNLSIIEKIDISTPINVAYLPLSLFPHTQSEISSSYYRLLDALGNVPLFNVCKFAYPPSLTLAHYFHQIIYSKCISNYFSSEYRDFPELISESTISMIHEGSSLSPHDYHEAVNWQSSFAEEINAALFNIDILISPSTCTTAPLRSDIEKPDPSLIWTLAGLPAVSVPIDLDSNGLPYGFQFSSTRFSDYKVLSFLEHISNLGLITNRSITPPVLA